MRYACWAGVLLLGFVSAALGALAPDKQVQEPVDGPYDVTFGLSSRGPQQVLLLDWDAGAGLAVTFEPKRTVVAEAGSSGRHVLATGPAADTAVRVKRRFPGLSVYCGTRLLLQTASGRTLGGVAAPASGARLTDLQVQPVEPADFHDEFFDPAGGESLWEPLSGKWEIGTYLDPLKALENRPIAASWYQCQVAGLALSVTGYSFWDECALRVALLPSPEVAAGLVFAYHDADNYQALLLKPAGVGMLVVERLVRHAAKTTRTPAGPAFAWRAGNWVDLVLRPAASGLQVESGGCTRATLPAGVLQPGRVGLLASGKGEARFDDFAAEGLRRTSDSFATAGPGEEWTAAAGKWRCSGKGVLEGTGTGLSLLLRRTGFDPDEVEAAVAGRGCCGVVLNWHDGSGYYLGVAGGRYSLCRVDKGQTAVLAQGPAAPQATLALSHRDGRLSSPLLPQPVYDFRYHGGSAGLFTTGEGSFRRFAAALEPQQLTVISRVSGIPQPMPGENSDTRRYVLGYVWDPQGGNWNGVGPAEDRRLTVRPYRRGTASLWYYRPCPGDAVIAVEDLQAVEGATAGVAVSSESPGHLLTSGYRAEVVSKMLRLYRGEKLVAEQTVEKSPASLRLWRDGAMVIAQADNAGIAFPDAKPLTGSFCAAYASGGEVSVREVALAHRRASYYAFRSEETDWQPVEGEWMTHSGMACIPWDYWYTAKGKPQAFAVNVHPLPANVHLDLWVGEYTEGYADGEHRHFPYHDLSLVTSAAAGQLDSGYRFVIGAEGGELTRLLRKGQVVAETREPRIVFGGHCNSPREMHVLLHQENGRLTLEIDHRVILEYQDPQPLGGGHLGIGSHGCAVNFRDLWYAALQ